MSIYDDLQAVATELLTEFDQGDVKLIKVSSNSTAPDDHSVQNETSYDLKAVVKGVSAKYLKEGFASVGDLEMTCAVEENIEPTINDFVVIKDLRYKIVQDFSVPAAGSVVARKFLLRRGG